MESSEPIWATRARMRRDAQCEGRGASITRYLWPSGKSYRITGRDVREASHAYLSGCASLFANHIDAASRRSPIGSGFFVDPHPDERYGSHLYLVTAAEVIRNKRVNDAPVIVMDSADQEPQLISTDRGSWRFNDRGDVAAIALNVRPRDRSHVVISEESFVTQDFLNQGELGLGDSVFIPEKSTCADNSAVNPASLMFGNISDLPEVGMQNNPVTRNLASAISMKIRSEGGCLGSPIFLCETPYNMHFGTLYYRAWKLGPRLLGVYVGPIPDEDRGQISLLNNAGRSPGREDREGRVVPIWSLLSMFEGRPQEKASLSGLVLEPGDFVSQQSLPTTSRWEQEAWVHERAS